LIPAQLLDDAGRLVEHFEVWLEEFERVRDEKKPELETPVVFAGPQGFGFPRQSEQKFIATFHSLRKEVYGIQPGIAKRSKSKNQRPSAPGRGL
jgi:hypothetical protein